MKLNCKQGDLAIIVRSLGNNEGKIVQCLELITDYKFSQLDRPHWRVDQTIPRYYRNGTFARHDNVVSDRSLRPLRGAEDEQRTTEKREVTA